MAQERSVAGIARVIAEHLLEAGDGVMMNLFSLITNKKANFLPYMKALLIVINQEASLKVQSLELVLMAFL